jgi:hypothetical protein
VWIAYPGDAQPVIDAGYDGADETTSANCYLYTDIAWVQGFEIHSAVFKFFECSEMAVGPTFIGNWFHDFHGSTSNSSFVMLPHSDGTYGPFVAANEFECSGDEGQSGLALLIYDSDRYLIADNHFHDIGAAFSPKDSARFWTFRNNTVDTFPLGHCLSSNMNAGVYTTSGEFCFNNLNGPFDGEGSSDYGAMEWGPTWISPVGASQVYRNTIRGVVGFAQFDTDDGPFTFFRNVIINGDSSTSPNTHMREVSGFSAPDWSRVTDSENLKGTSGAGYIDAAGLLTGSARTSYLYLRGHEVPS